VYLKQCGLYVCVTEVVYCKVSVFEIVRVICFLVRVFICVCEHAEFVWNSVGCMCV